MAMRRREAQDDACSVNTAQLAMLTKFTRHAAEFERGQNRMPILLCCRVSGN